MCITKDALLSPIKTSLVALIQQAFTIGEEVKSSRPEADSIVVVTAYPDGRITMEFDYFNSELNTKLEDLDLQDLTRMAEHAAQKLVFVDNSTNTPIKPDVSAERKVDSLPDSAKPKTFTRDEMLKRLPVVVSDLKHFHVPANHVRNNANIRSGLYRHVILELYSDTRFKHNEPVEPHREGMFIKGYVRDIWNYLEEAYDIIHSTDFETDFADLIAQTA